MRSGSATILEHLEQRLALSTAGVTVVDSTLIIIGDNRPQIVEIADTQSRDAGTSTIVSVDFNGNGSFDDPGDLHNASYTGITEFRIDLRGGNDQLSFTAGEYFATTRKLSVNLGNGDDQAQFAFVVGNSMRATDISLNLSAGSGNDSVDLAIGNVRAESTFDIKMNLGSGKDTLTSSLLGDVGASRLSMNANLGTGADTSVTNIDYANFDIPGAEGLLQWQVHGGQGDDTLRFGAINTESGNAGLISGTIEVLLDGDSGNDTIDFDLPPLHMNGGTVSVVEEGDSGKDIITLNLEARADSTGGTFSAKLLGGPQDDILTANINDASGNIIYDGDVLLNGGPGHDIFSTSGNAPFQVRQ